MLKRVLAFDYGASSGRAILAQIENGKISYKEIHRFENNPLTENSTLFWDFPMLFDNLKEGIKKAQAAGGFDCIGIDTWGIDFGLIGKDGALLENPVHYRDLRTNGVPEQVFDVVSKEEIYSTTGIQFIRFNTLYQLFYLAKNRPELLTRADKFLLMPDLFAYMLTGVMRAEYTNATTTQCLRSDGKWAFEITDRLGISRDIFPQIIHPGELYGNLSEKICNELNVPPIPVIAVATHDTGSAVVSVPAKADEKFAYISSGTWSLMGAELNSPLINEATAKFNFTNEGGAFSTVRMLKNIMGLWMVQECRRFWSREDGKKVSFDTLEKAARTAHFEGIVNVDAPEFEQPGDMPLKVISFFEKLGQPAPQTRGEIMLCIYNSMADKYASTLDCLSEITGKKYDVLHIIGGGSKDGFLCELTAKKCGVKVLAGPVEATALGNIAVQFIASDEFGSLQSARNSIIFGEKLTSYDI